MPVISAMGNLPVVKDLVVDMEPFWAKFRAVKPWLHPGYDEPPEEKEYRRPAGADERDPQGVPLHQLRLLRLRVQLDGVRPRTSSGPQALAKGMRFVGDPRDGATRRAARATYNGEHGIWDCTRCYFCNERCPKGVDPRDAIAKLGAEAIKEGIDRDMGAKHAKWFVTLGRDDRLAARDRARAEDAGHLSSIKRDEVRAGAREAGQGAAAVPAARRRERRRGAGAARARAGAGQRGCAGIVQGEQCRSRSSSTRRDGESGPQAGVDPECRDRPGREPR